MVASENILTLPFTVSFMCANTTDYVKKIGVSFVPYFTQEEY
jgi:hypothetical protein